MNASMSPVTRPRISGSYSAIFCWVNHGCTIWRYKPCSGGSDIVSGNRRSPWPLFGIVGMNDEKWSVSKYSACRSSYVVIAQNPPS